jgi:glycosyltransferase involved in cell wall biosynthesis
MAHLVFLGFGNERAVVERLAQDPRFAGRLHVLNAVPPSELLEMIAGADVDAVPLQKSSLNHWLCTPNKLWESLTAGVPVVVSDFPAMHEIVLDGPDGSLGEICEPSDPPSIGAAICRILALAPEGRAALRERCLHAAQTRWNWETESVGLLDLYAGLAAEQGRAAHAASA